jgi:hypothetical protein
MAQKEKEKHASEEPRTTVELESPKFAKPNVLLIDIDKTVSERLKKEGFNVHSGTFGSPYKVTKSSDYQPVIAEPNLPNRKEQEIIIIDLAMSQLLPTAKGQKHRPDEEKDWWAKCDRGFTDPRTRTMYGARSDFDRILNHGGMFIIFADEKDQQDLVFARSHEGRGLYDSETINENNWSFLSQLSELKVMSDEATELKVAGGSNVLIGSLFKHLKSSFATCTVESFYANGKWEVLALNKYGSGVSIAWKDEESKGSIVILPQLVDKAGYLSALFKSVLPEISPHLFPDSNIGKWVQGLDYELPTIIELKAEQKALEERARADIQALENRLEAERAANGWIHELLTGTDTRLVEAVKKALATLKFDKIIDVDEQRDLEAKSRREDLQIDEKRPTLIVDVKGIGGFPADEDALQADKHAAMRMREWKRTDVSGLSIINHQRHLPPLERDNLMPFRQELIDAAQERTLGLMTAWDLYRLVRNYQRHSWMVENIKPLFYKTGRIEIIPEHYIYLGTIAKAWTDKFGVVIEASELNVGDRVAIEFPIEFEEINVGSIQIKERSVNKANVDDPAGILWPSGKPKLREGLRVFRIPKS